MNYQNQDQSNSNFQKSQQGYQANNAEWQMYQSHSDPYNYPALNRKDLMNLQTIQPYETGFYNVKNNTLRDANLNILDIRGAQPKFKIQELNKPDLHNVNDIDGSQPKPHIQFTNYNKVSNILKNDDIKGSHPNINKFQTTRPPFNPLEPEYHLQEAQQIIVDPPKFLRDTLYIDDIDGTRARSKIMAYDKQLPDIEGAKAKKKFYPRDYVDSLNVLDINNKKHVETVRNVNPLNPTYNWQFDEDNKQSQPFGYIDGSNSRQLHKQLPKPYDKYASSDIHGAQASSLIKKYNTNHRYAYCNQDIDGTQANTRKIGIQTKRCINPLRPDYQFLGRNETDNQFGGFNFSNQGQQQQQQQSQPRSQLAASASQNLIRANHQVAPASQQQLSLSQSVSNLPPRDVSHNAVFQQQQYQQQQQVYEHQQQQQQQYQQQQQISNGQNKSNQRYMSEQQQQQQYQNVEQNQFLPFEQQLNQIPKMFYEGAQEYRNNALPSNQLNDNSQNYYPQANNYYQPNDINQQNHNQRLKHY